MRLLLDTHFVVWLTLDPSRLTSAERALVSRSDVEFVCSAVSIWELRLKWQSVMASGARKGPLSPESAIAFAEASEWTFLPLLPRHAAISLAEPISHKDPFDEMLLLQAQAEGLRLLTRDDAILGHPLSVH